ncbi:MAG: hypothetical protein NC204_05605 [Candidatus Amulumruptor caecigallinarius]|nr:hypothetical protein [Candidatus Amulumruptor caecigallinarius]
MIDFECNADNFWGLVGAMAPRERMRHMKGAMRTTANSLKRRASELFISGLNHVRSTSELKKTIWIKVYDRISGFRVSVAGNKHPYMSAGFRNGRKVPLARWMEEGTGERTTGSGAIRGRLRPMKFLARANEEMEANISQTLSDNFLKGVARTAKKYGCI